MRLMKYFPYENWTVESPLNTQELAETLGDRMEANASSSVNEDFLRGSIRIRGFELSQSCRSVFYKPVLYGKFSPSPRGTSIRIRMTLSVSGLVFFAGPIAFIGLFLLLLIPDFLQGRDLIALPGCGLMLWIHGFIAYKHFTSVSGNTKALIMKLLEELYRKETPKTLS